MRDSGLKLRNEQRLLWVGLLLVLLLAAALRFYHLDGQSLWADEGNSVALAGRSLADITYGSAYDIHPPLYYYLLHFWVRLFGTSEFAVRSLSAVIGTLLVGLTFLLGRRLFDSWVGLVAAFLSAISPFQVYYSQEARMYILLAALSALSIYFFHKFVEAEAADTGRQPPLYLWAGLYVLATVLALYTHYSFPFILLVENLVYAFWLIAEARRGGGRGRRRELILGRALRWAALQLTVVLLFLPWLPTAYRQVTTWPTPHQAYSLLPTLADVYRLLCLGLSVETSETVGPLVIFAFFILAGSFSPVDEANDQSASSLQVLPWSLRYGLVVLWAALPTVLIFALGLFRETHLKFLLVSSSPFSLLVGLGIVNTWRIASEWRAGLSRSDLGQPAARVVVLLLVAFTLLASGQSLLNYYGDPQYARDDYRGLARYVAATAGPNDAIILNAPGQEEIFGYYYKGDLLIYPLPQQRPLDPGQTRRELEAIVSQHAKVFAVLWATDESDPGRFVEGWLDEWTYKALDTWYGNVRLAVYAVPQTGPPTEMAYPLSASLDDKVMLLGYSFPSKEVYAGNVLPLTLFWQALTSLDERYVVFIHVLDADGHIVGQRDTEPGGGAMLTPTWQPGQTIADNYGVLISHGTPPGEYRVQVGMYALGSGMRLPISRVGQPPDDSLTLEPIRILRPKALSPLEALDMQYWESLDYSDLKLLGYDLYKLGYAHQKEEPLYPGDILHLDLYWQALDVTDADWQLGLQLVDKEGQSWAIEEEGPIGGSYGTSSWQAGEVVRDQHDLLISPDVPAGRYHLVGQVRPSADGEVLSPTFESKELVIR
jgi:4-amino-4-deoxy-L-arabinose transferase-like glycosyltransferase